MSSSPWRSTRLVALVPGLPSAESGTCFLPSHQCGVMVHTTPTWLPVWLRPQSSCVWRTQFLHLYNLFKKVFFRRLISPYLDVSSACSIIKHWKPPHFHGHKCLKRMQLCHSWHTSKKIHRLQEGLAAFSSCSELPAFGFLPQLESVRFKPAQCKSEPACPRAEPPLQSPGWEVWHSAGMRLSRPRGMRRHKLLALTR